MQTKNNTKMKGTNKNDQRREDLLKAKDWFMTLMEGCKKGIPEFTEVAKETTFEVRITNDGHGICFEADVNIVPDYEREDVDRKPIEAEDIPEGVDVDEQFKEAVKHALKAANGNLQKAADMLGMSKHGLKSQLAAWNL